jgi:tRNA nucleotidyltransferase/poly(A) polymerase
MDESTLSAAAGEEAYVVGGAVRDELLGRRVVDVDVACRDPRAAARAYADDVGGALFALSERHGAWRIAFRDGRTVDFTPLPDGIEDDLRTRDFTANAIARPLGREEHVDPLGGLRDLEHRVLRAVSERIFADDPLRLLRAVRLEDELGLRMDAATEALVRREAALVTRPAGERILAELERLSADGFRRLEELGLLAPLGGSLGRLGAVESAEHADYLLVVVLGEALFALPASNETKRFARTLLTAKPPSDASPREIHRFRLATEPWALEALAYVGASEFADAVRAARAHDPAQPLLRGDELGVPPGPEVGRLLERIAEERAAGAISTREDALELVRREARRQAAAGDE